MNRVITIGFIIGTAMAMDNLAAFGVAYGAVNPHAGLLNDINFVLIGIIVGGIYLFRFGSNYSEEGICGPQKSLNDFSILALIPGKDRLIDLMKALLSPLKRTVSGRYLKSIYSPPIPSERVLGGFFFGKTMITTAIAFYQLDPFLLIVVLAFSAVFDSLTGTYQHTLMNFFHRSSFKSKTLRFVQNITKRFMVDVFRAEVIMLILCGSELLTSGNQLHIFKNRLVSASYYFNAIIIDKLVDMSIISRNFRSNFVIGASTVGGMLCLLDFAKTSLPGWVPQALIPESMPGPLKLLMYFNVSTFMILGLIYMGAECQKGEKSSLGFISKFFYQKVNLVLLRMISLLGRF